MIKKGKQAAALTYDHTLMTPPKVTAVGKGLVAENIIEIAKDHDVPIVEDASLVELLSQLEINEAIPEQLYQAVAEVFAFVYHLDRKNNFNDFK